MVKIIRNNIVLMLRPVSQVAAPARQRGLVEIARWQYRGRNLPSTEEDLHSDSRQFEGRVVKSRNTYSSFDDFVLHVDAINAQNVIAEVKCLEPALLAEQNNQCAASPVHSLTKQLPATDHPHRHNQCAASPVHPLTKQLPATDHPYITSVQITGKLDG